MKGPRPRNPSERFWRFVERAADGCWNWTGARNAPGGYGVLGARQSSRVVYAHRLSYEMNRGPIPAGLFVCHTCDNKGCVNPAHLFLGTAKDNALDASGKGLLNIPSKGQPGELNYFHRLTADQVRAIRASNESARVLGQRFGVVPDHIAAIRRGAAWKSLL